jgi:hypothetical protein
MKFTSTRHGRAHSHLLGQQIEDLFVQKDIGNDDFGNICWECECFKCGKIIIRTSNQLNRRYKVRCEDHRIPETVIPEVETELSPKEWIRHYVKNMSEKDRIEFLSELIFRQIAHNFVE